MSISNILITNDYDVKVGSLDVSGNSIDYGEFSPTISNQDNVASVTDARCIYSKTGSTYDVAFEAKALEVNNVDPSSFEFTLDPFTDIVFTSVESAIGVGTKVTLLGIGVIARLSAVVGTNRLKIAWMIIGAPVNEEIAVQITFSSEFP